MQNDERDNGELTKSQENLAVNRRDCLKAVGSAAATVAFTATVGSASTSETGYGVGGFGEGGYGGGVTEDEGEETTDEKSVYPNTIIIDGTDTDRLNWYRFTVSGEIAPHEEPIDNIYNTDEETVYGLVAQDTDKYNYSGEIISLRVVGNASVHLE